MKLLDSLLDAIVRLEGDALVMHVGEKPYVITASSSMNAYRGPLAWGQVELSSRVLTFDAVSSMLTQILPIDQQRALDEFGAIEHEILPPNGILDRFTVIAARGGEDVWVEVRRKPVPPPVADTAPEVIAPEDESAAVAEPEPLAAAGDLPGVSAVEPAPVHSELTLGRDPENNDQPGEEPSASPELSSPETVVVALPGEDSQEVSLTGESENTIQVIDDEPQGVPTEAEVDAMLAATATALLTSGLSTDRVADEAEADAQPQLESDAAPIVAQPEIVLEVTVLEVAAPEDVVPEGAVPEVAEPAFELSPPPAVAAEPPEPEVEAAEPSHETAPGTPLFSDEAVSAAAAPTAPAVALDEFNHAGDLELSLDDEIQIGPIEITPEPPREDVVEEAPASEYDRPRAAIDDVTATPFVVNNLNAGPEPAASEPAPPAPDPTPAEMRMDATPEPRHHEGVAGVEHRLHPSAPDTHESLIHADAESDARSGVVVPLARSPIKTETVSVPYTPAEDAALMHTLRVAAARGAATVYVVAGSKPMVRVDGEIVPLESEPALSAADVDRLVLELAPPRRRDALQNGPVEWLCDVPEIGRVRCLTFKDHRGPGVLFRMFPPRAISADQLGLTAEVQALCQQSDGLVLVTGARASGKSTLLNAFVDLINRTRSDHVITVESQIGFVHESRRSFISQRETRGDAEFAASVARAALREDPDVMMIEDLKSAELVSAALEAAESGRLVLASVPAASTIGALERLVEVFPADRRGKARASLASSLRGVLAQVLLRRVTGGRIAAREILLNTPAVSTLVLEGKMFQLPVALDSGRRHGMVPLTDSLAGLVREGTVHVGEAYRKALDRAALVAALKREGVDTSFAERLA